MPTKKAVKSQSAKKAKSRSPKSKKIPRKEVQQAIANSSRTVATGVAVAGQLRKMNKISAAYADTVLATSLAVAVGELLVPILRRTPSGKKPASKPASKPKNVKDLIVSGIDVVAKMEPPKKTRKQKSKN